MQMHVVFECRPVTRFNICHCICLIHFTARWTFLLNKSKRNSSIIYANMYRQTDRQTAMDTIYMYWTIVTFIISHWLIAFSSRKKASFQLISTNFVSIWIEFKSKLEIICIWFASLCESPFQFWNDFSTRSRTLVLNFSWYSSPFMNLYSVDILSDNLRLSFICFACLARTAHIVHCTATLHFQRLPSSKSYLFIQCKLGRMEM